MRSTESPLLRIQDTRHVRTLVLSRPHRRNALNTQLTAMLIAALRGADEDPAIGAVVIAGEGPSFCAGADLSEFKGESANPQREQHRGDLYLELQLLFAELDVPIICALTGNAIGLGAAIAVAADLTVAAESSRINYPEVAHGMVPSLMIGHLQRRLGRKFAFELLATGRALMGPEALSLGLVNRLVAEDDVGPAAMVLAEELASQDRSVLRETKRLFVDLADMPLADSLRAAYEASRRRRAKPLKINVAAAA